MWGSTFKAVSVRATKSTFYRVRRQCFFFSIIFSANSGVFHTFSLCIQCVTNKMTRKKKQYLMLHFEKKGNPEMLHCLRSGYFPRFSLKIHDVLNSSEKALGNNKSNLPPFSTHLSSKLKRLKANTNISLIISQSEKLSF